MFYKNQGIPITTNILKKKLYVLYVYVLRSLIIGNLLYLFNWTKKTDPFINLLLSYELC